MLAIRLIVVLLFSLSSLLSAHAEDAYIVGPQDTLTLSVFDWRGDTDAPYQWTALSRDLRVEASGLISVPLIGSVQVSGKTLEQVADLISERLKEEVGPLIRPTATVEIKEYRPIYIVGAVNQPGEYAFRPGLKVLQAIGLAGGMQRAADSLFSRFERDAINARGDLQVIKGSLDALVAKRARLIAELQNAEEIDFSTNLTKRQGEPAIARVMEEEKFIFLARKHSLEAKVEAGQKLRRLLSNQITSMKAQIELRELQIASAREELANVEKLVDRGLGTAGRQLTLERTVHDYESSRLDLERSIIAAEVAIAEAERDIIELQGRLREDAAVELRETDGEIGELSEKFATVSQLLQEAEVTAPLKAASIEEAEGPSGTKLSILREVNGETTEIAVDENALVKPGDTVRVTVELPDIAVTESLSSVGTIDLNFDLDAEPFAESSLLDDGATTDPDGDSATGTSKPGTSTRAAAQLAAARVRPPDSTRERATPDDAVDDRQESERPELSAPAGGVAEDQGNALTKLIAPPPSTNASLLATTSADALPSKEDTDEAAHGTLARNTEDSHLSGTGGDGEVSAAPGGRPMDTASKPVDGETLVVTASALNVRNEPQPDAGILLVYERGTRVKVLESRDGWVRVQTSDGSGGWVSAEHVVPATEVH